MIIEKGPQRKDEIDNFPLYTSICGGVRVIGMNAETQDERKVDKVGNKFQNCVRTFPYEIAQGTQSGN